ncbi:hypothetical protein B7C51_12475 [Paenibacillus larvae subsp. pulvifaciens]|uniref:SLH domain-containing protein n=2 Tax=Paenibacillus larvae TaxID=1464 RepID=A0A1V0UT78_9BACL|nr:hypothetical protein B7C51_12475 [Paenibacillus larvae subsp. pulvifaciens]
MRNMGSIISNDTQNEKQFRGGEKKVMKKSLSVIVSSAMALSMFSSVAFGAKIDDFKDLKDLSAKDKAKFAAMIDANILHGLTSDYFGLYEATNRAQFARVAADVFKLKVDTSLEKSSFSDVSKEDPANGYALPYIEAAKDNGIAAGYEDGTYRPDKTLTKEELATLLVKGLGFKDEAEAATGSDPSVSDWAQGYVKVAVEKGIMNNDTNGMFNGQQLVNRYMLVTSTYPVFEKNYQQIVIEGAKVTVNSDDTATVTGTAKNAITVKVTVGDTTKEVQVKEDGTFSYTTDKLPTGDTTISLVAYNGENKSAQVDLVATIGEAAVNSVTMLNEKTAEVKLNKSIGDVTRENIVVKQKDGERQYVQAVKWDENKQVATLTFFNDLPNNKDFTIELKSGSSVAKGEFKVAITEVSSIVLNDMTVPVDSPTPIEYKVLDANGVDITASTKVTLNSTKPDVIVDNKITLAKDDVVFVQAEATKKDGSKVLSKQIRVVAEGTEAVTLDKFTIAAKGSADFDSPNTFITEDKSDQFIQIQVKDKFGKEATTQGARFESLNKDVALVDRSTGAITPIKPGKVDVRVKVGAVDQVVSFEVGAKAVAKTIELDKSSILISTAAPTETVNIVVKDQYGNEFKKDELAAISKDTNVAKADLDKNKNLVIEAVNSGATTVEVKLGDITRTVTVEVKQPGAVASYKLEGFVKELDQYKGKDNENIDQMTLNVAGYDENGVKAVADVKAEYTVTDKDGKEVEKAVNNNKIEAKNLTAGETYTLTVKVGTLTVATESFKVINTEVKAVYGFNLVKDAITVEKSTDLIEALNGENRTAFEIVKDGVSIENAKIQSLKFFSDDSKVVASAKDAAESAKFIGDGQVSILITEVKVDLNGTSETITTNSLIEINVKSVAAAKLEEAKAAAETEIGNAEKSVNESKVKAEKAVKDAEKAVQDNPDDKNAAADLESKRKLLKNVNAEVTKVTEAKTDYVKAKTVDEVQIQVTKATDAKAEAARLVENL